MYTTISVILFLVIGMMGIFDVRLPSIKPLIALSCRIQDKPIMDPDDGSGRTFEQDKPRLTSGQSGPTGQVAQQRLFR
jgi:hypothetical protein